MFTVEINKEFANLGEAREFLLHVAGQINAGYRKGEGWDSTDLDQEAGQDAPQGHQNGAQTTETPEHGHEGGQGDTTNLVGPSEEGAEDHTPSPETTPEEQSQQPISSDEEYPWEKGQKKYGEPDNQESSIQ